MHVIRIEMKRSLERPHTIFHEHDVEFLLDAAFGFIKLQEVRAKTPAFGHF